MEQLVHVISGVFVELFRDQSLTEHAYQFCRDHPFIAWFIGFCAVISLGYFLYAAGANLVRFVSANLGLALSLRGAAVLTVAATLAGVAASLAVLFVTEAYAPTPNFRDSAKSFPS